MELQLSNEEKLYLQNNQLKVENLKLTIDKIFDNQKAFITDYCKRNSQNPEDITNVDFEKGIITFKEKAKE